MFTHSDIITPLHLKSIDGPRGRHYTLPSGNKVPSITTILGSGDKPWLNDWRASLGHQKADKEMKRASDRGTAVHLMLERLLLNNDNPTAGQHIDHIAEFNSLRCYVKKINNILLQEGALYSDTLNVAGRVDCIAEFANRLAIIDFKTSTTSKTEQMILLYFLQTTFYALAFEERYDIQVEDIIIIMSVERGLPLLFKGKVDDYIKSLLECINTYYNKLGAV